MTAARRFLPHYTLDDYRQWAGDWELWQGIPVAMAPSPFGRHQRVARNLVVALDHALHRAGCDAEVLYEIDWIISNDTVVRPDVVVVCGEPPERHVNTPPALAAEVISPATAERDRTYKRDLYDQQGVGVYLLLDPEARTLEACRRDDTGAWIHQPVESRVELRLCGDCEIALPRESLFSR